MATHYEEVCQYGYVHGQCRCPSKNKEVRRVMCNNEAHLPKEGSITAGELSGLSRDLVEAGEKRQNADVAAIEAMEDLKVLVLKAYDKGYSKTQISALAQITRQTVYNILEADK